MKKFLVACIYFVSFSCFASTADCGQALPANHVGFCASFKAVAACHCEALGYPSAVCNHMSLLYKAMLVRYGSQQHACESQHDTSVQTCMDDWNCYRSGGADSQGRLCSATGNAC